MRRYQVFILAAELLFHALHAAETLLQAGVRLLGPAKHHLKWRKTLGETIQGSLESQLFVLFKNLRL